MGLALEQARRATAEGEIPVGAVVLDASGKVLSTGRNACRGSDAASYVGGDAEVTHPDSTVDAGPTAHADPTAHAEIVAIRRAAEASQRGTLEGCTLVVTLEPCAMCAGAILAARIPVVVFGAWDEKAGAAGSVHDLLRDRRLPHRCEVIAGVEEESSKKLLREFFEQRR